VLAIGLLIPLAGIDNQVDAFTRSTFGVSTGLLLSGSLFAITLAYVIRFLAVALAPIEAGLGRVSTNLDAAARTLGESALSVLWRVHLPLLVPPLGAAALLVFVDSMRSCRRRCSCGPSTSRRWQRTSTASPPSSSSSRPR
jgi:iron(III) transport system permease protein